MSFIATTDMYIEMRNKRDLVEDKLHDMTKQRDTLIDDIAVLKANISRLERGNEKQLDLLKDFSKFINYKLIVSPASDTYKHYRSELDKLGVK